MKRIWKPINVGCLRLYEVRLYWYPPIKEKPSQIELYKAQHGFVEIFVVASTAPRRAAELIENIYREAYDNNPNVSHWYVKGLALNVNQPEEWKDEGPPCPDCEPERFRRY